MSDPSAHLIGIIDRLREAAAAMLVPIDHRSHENSSWPSSECDDCMSIRKARADRLRAALSDSTPSAPTLDAAWKALESILGEAEEFTVHQHGSPSHILNIIADRARVALATRLHETSQPEPRSPSRRAPKYPLR